MLVALLRNRCPQCREGKVFSGLYKMNDRCPRCDLRFEREPGYFLGAMMIGYFVGAAALLPTVILGTFVFNIPFGPLMCVAALQVLIMNPVIFRLSRLAWLHAEHRITKKLS